MAQKTKSEAKPPAENKKEVSQTQVNQKLVAFLERRMSPKWNMHGVVKKTGDGFVAFYEKKHLFAGVTAEGMFLHVGKRLKPYAAKTKGFSEPNKVPGLELKNCFLVGKEIYGHENTLHGWVHSICRDILLKRFN